MKNTLTLNTQNLYNGIICIRKESGRKIDYIVKCEPATDERANEILADFQNAEKLSEIAQKYDATVDLV